MQLRDERVRELALIISFVLLSFVVTSGAFFIRSQFQQAHDDSCAVAGAFVDLAAADLVLLAEQNPAAVPESVHLVNTAIVQLNDTCDLHLPPVHA